IEQQPPVLRGTERPSHGNGSRHVGEILQLHGFPTRLRSVEGLGQKRLLARKHEITWSHISGHESAEHHRLAVRFIQRSDACITQIPLRFWLRSIEEMPAIGKKL